MPIMMIFMLLSMLLLAMLVLASTLHLLTSKYAHNTLFSSHSKGIAVDSSTGGSSSCQTCHFCGGLRLRSKNASHGHHVEDTARGESRTTRHWLAAIKIQIILSIRQAIQKLMSHQKGQARVDFLSKLAKLSDVLKQKTPPQPAQSQVMGLVSAGLPRSECSSNCLIGSSSDSSVNSTNLNPITMADTSEVVAQGPQRSPEVHLQGLQAHRVVLEILVSPSGNAKESTCASSPGLTLKLETSAPLEHLASHVAALKSKDIKKCDHNTDIAHILSGVNDALPGDLCLGCAHGDKVSQRLRQLLKEAVLSQKGDTTCADFVATKLETVGRETVCDAFRLKKDYQAFMNLQDCAQCGLTVGDIVQPECLKSDISAARNCSPGDEKIKYTVSKHSCGDDAAEVDIESIREAKLGSQVASELHLSSFGSLHISLVKHKDQEEDADGSGLTGSPLASLNVTGKPIGGKGSSSMKREKLNSKLSALSDASCSKSVLIGGLEAGGVSGINSVKVEEPCPLKASMDTPLNDSFGSSPKKSKKKKNRAKKPKVNVESLVMDVKELQGIGKIASEAKHVSAFPERELGCLCGALKGHVHTESCPYPFTLSGSMLQRKMREQYNQLVRSNAAKTLTLAQVGQFASCLVEAKATLRQKSESIQRKFTIAKSLLAKADKSSFDRLCGQIYGLEMEQKKLEEDTVVYNRLQEQLKLSPAYQKMLEYGRAHFEVQPHTGQMIEKLEPEDLEMSFEEFLAQEKKDAFWQRHSLARSAVSAS